MGVHLFKWLAFSSVMVDTYVVLGHPLKLTNNGMDCRGLACARNPRYVYIDGFRE
jgi:hypothetical protein